MSSIPRRRFFGAAGGAALSLPLAQPASAAPVSQQGGHGRPPSDSLGLWPEPAAARMLRLVRTFTGRGRYAVFDADNTLWNHDLEEALLPFLEMNGILRPSTIDPSLRLIPFRDGESLYSYYVRLCALDNKVGYPWIAQVFSGMSLHELKQHVDNLFAYREAIPVTYYQADSVVHDTVSPPRIYPAQRQLVRVLGQYGITVYVVTAAHEELVRMVVSDPSYGIDVDPENVIGVTTLLRDPGSGDLTTARKQIAEGHFLDDEYPRGKHLRSVVTPYLWSPPTWYVGKRAGIEDYIADYERPVLAAGDSPSDWSMLFYADVLPGGERVWVDRDSEYTAALAKEKRKRTREQREARTPADAGHGWITVRPEDLGGGE